ncbi:LacI family transcriptional regulator [Caldicoprobacter algeriensis]|uniref:LacI family DNA-binding transcriptional regulator n=1 Tax=Caldicoprobacter algeriensis TaxID=699281 RepID=UPI00207B0320|nr:LacI family DNA-binding transcriptional regulator [Caldicoprobacter algeriensis]MCM8899895.1 LacI family transcriptional regulator [Caldicoprobacter algeriensis]
MATLKDIAVKAGVSIATVSYVLNNKGKISRETQEKVIKAARELGYQIDIKTRLHQYKKPNIIGVVTSNFGGPFFSRLLKSIEKSANDNGYHLIAYSTNIGSTDYFIKHVFNTHRPSGLIVMAYNVTDEILIKYSSQDFPIVTIDREIEGPHLYSVIIDNFQGAYDAVKYLIDCGHREIGFMGGAYNMVYETQLRYKGYCDALKDAGIDPEKQLYCQGAHTEKGGYTTAKMLLTQRKMPPAMFCTNDEMAIGVIKACTEAGVRIPDDVSIVGFDDIESAKNIKPSLTTIRQPMEELAETAVQTLVMAMHGNSPIKHIKLPTKLIIRESVKCL